jgi:hypothetical protein
MQEVDLYAAWALLAAGTVLSFILAFLQLPPFPGIMTFFAGLAVLLVRPSFEQAVVLGFIAGVLAALVGPGLVVLPFLISEPLGCAVCLWASLTIVSRPAAAPGLSLFLATLASGAAFTALTLSSDIFAASLGITPGMGEQIFLVSLTVVMAAVNALAAVIAFPILRNTLLQARRPLLPGKAV